MKYWPFIIIALIPGLIRAEELNDLFSARWFEAEIVVFERLDVLDVNEREQLTHYQPRHWPANLMLPFTSDATPVDLTNTAWLETSAAYCLGYPLLREEDPVHPDLQINQFDQFDTLDEEDDAASSPDELEADIDDLGLSEEPVADTEPDIDAMPAVVQPPTPLELLQTAVTEYEQTLYDSSYQWLPRQTLTMINDVKAINRNRHLRPLWHGRWRQPVPDRQHPQPFYFSTPITLEAPATAAGFAKVEGYFDLTVARYLHFGATLWYHADTLGMAPLAMPFAETSPMGINTTGYMEMQQSRRMRSGQLHYLDHPKLGIIIRIDPLEPPQHLLDGWASLERR